MSTYIRAQAKPWNFGVALYIGDREGKTVVQEIVLKRVDDVNASAPSGPSFEISTEQAQVLIDDLWNAGIRPTEGNGSAGAMRAVERHLEDMRKIAFNALVIDPK